MTNGLLLDTSVMIAHEKGKLNLANRLDAEPEGDCFLSAVSAAELLHGIHRGDAEQRRKRAAFAHQMLDVFEVIDFDLRVARVHAETEAAMFDAGRSVGVRDLMIGSTALAYQLAVATRDERSFPRIPGLDVRLWR